MRSFWSAAALILGPVILLSACKPPPTDAGLSRELPADEPVFASAPLASPEVEDAVWARSSVEGRIIYGVPGQAALVALECLRDDPASPTLRIARLAPADEGAGALLALVGNGAVGRLPVDATEVGGRLIWQGDLPATDSAWDPFDGPRQVTLTVPGAGMVTLNRSPAPGSLLRACRERPRPPE